MAANATLTKTAMEFAVGLFFVMLLLSVAGFFLGRTSATARFLRTSSHLPADDERYFRRQISRRRLTALLLIALAGFLIGWYFLEPVLLPRPGEAAPLDDNAKHGVRLAIGYWSLALVLLAAVVLLALADFAATARFGMRLQRRLEQSHRDRLAEDLERWRRDNPDKDQAR